MDDARLVKISKYLSKHLRHQPERLGLTLAPGGWVDVEITIIMPWNWDSIGFPR